MLCEVEIFMMARCIPCKVQKNNSFLCTSGNPHPMNQEHNYGYINKNNNEREFVIK
jgi:hypothetical protein